MQGNHTDWYWRGGLFSRPKISPGFIGRDFEKSTILDFLKSEKSLLNIVGFGGVGKTFLCAWFAQEIQKQRKIAWIDCRTQTISIDSVLSSIGLANQDEFIQKRINENTLEEPRRGFSDPLTDLVDRCIDLIDETQAVLLFDDFHDLDEHSSNQIQNHFLKYIIPRLSKGKIIISSRRLPMIWYDQELLGYQQHLKLSGFNHLELEKYLDQKTIRLKEDELELLWNKTGRGIPKAVVIIANKLGEQEKVFEEIQRAQFYNQKSDSEWLKEQIQDLNYHTLRLAKHLAVLRKPESVEFCEEVWDESDFTRRLRELKANCLLDETVPQNDIQLFNLIRESMLVNEITKSEKIDLHLKISQKYFHKAKTNVENKIPSVIEAIWHADQGEDFEKVLSIAKFIENNHLDQDFSLISQVDTIIIDASRKLDQKEILSNWLDHFSTRLIISGKMAESLDALQEARKISNELNNKSRWLDISRKLAKVFNARGEYSQSLKIIEACMENVQDLENRALELELLPELGNYLFRNNRVIEAEKVLKDSLSASKEANLPDLEANAMIKLARIYLKSKKDPSRQLEAKNLLVKAEILCTNSESKSLIGEVYGLLGDYHRYNYDLEQALQYYEKSLQLCIDQKFKRNESITRGQMAFLERDLGNIEEAIQHSKRSYQIADQLGDVVGKQIQMVLLGELLTEKNKFEEAYKNLNEALSIANDEKNPQPTGVASAYRGFAKYHLKIGHLDQAEEYIDRAIELYVSQNNFQYANECLPVLGKIYQSYSADEVDILANKLNELILNDQIAYKIERIQILSNSIFKILNSSEADSEKIKFTANPLYLAACEIFSSDISLAERKAWCKSFIEVLENHWDIILSKFIADIPTIEQYCSEEEIYNLYGWWVELEISKNQTTQLNHLVSKIIESKDLGVEEKYDLLETLEGVCLHIPQVKQKIKNFYSNEIIDETNLAIRQKRSLTPLVTQMLSGLYLLTPEEHQRHKEFILTELQKAKEVDEIPEEFSILPESITIDLMGKSIALLGGNSPTRHAVADELINKYGLTEYKEVAPSWEQNVNRNKVSNAINGVDLIVAVPRKMKHAMKYALDSCITQEQKQILRYASGGGKSSIIEEVRQFFSS